MDLVFAYDTYYLIILNMASILLLSIVNFFIFLKAKKTPLLFSYLVTQGLLLIWMIFKILKTVAPDADSKFLFVVFQYVGISFLGEAFFLFSFLYRKARLPSVKFLVLLSIPPILSLTLLITNPIHMLFYSEFDFWGDRFGPLFYLHQAYNYVLILLGIILCAKDFRHQFGEKRIQALLFSVAILIPLAANTIYVFGFFEPIFGFSPPCDITPISCNLSLMIFALGTFRYRFFDDLKIARATALSSIPDGILLLDEKMRIIDFNDTFKTLFEKGLLFSGEGSGLVRRGSGIRPLSRFDRADFLEGAPENFDRTYETEGGSHYRVICRVFEKAGSIRGYSLRFIDLSLKQAILLNLQCKNEELSALNEKLKKKSSTLRNLSAARARNRIAGEAHDLLGHTVILVISILEIARLSLGKPGFYLHPQTEKAMEILRHCTVKRFLSEQAERDAERPGLLDRIKGLIDETAGTSVEVRLSVSGTVSCLPYRFETELYRLCREGITNAIRHGKASQIDLIFRFSAEEITAYVIDNGAGCQSAVKGVGISGMEERFKQLGGSVSFGSFGGQGFFLQAALALRQDCF